MERKAKQVDASQLEGTRGWCAFDIETADMIKERGGVKMLTHSFTVTYSEFDGYLLFVSGEETALLDYLNLHERIVSFNGDGFDLVVLTKYGSEVADEVKKKSWDLMRKIQRGVGHRVSLDSVGKAYGFGKTASGGDAVRWWNGRKFEERVSGFKYCRSDVKILVKAVRAVKKSGSVKFKSKKTDGIVNVEVDWLC